MRPARSLVLFACATALTAPVAGCATSEGQDSLAGAGVAANPAAVAPGAQPPANKDKAPAPREEQPSSPSKDPDGVPTNIPKAIPNPEPPPDPAKIALKARATSSTSNPLAGVGQQGYARVSTYVDLAWSASKQAASYRVSVNDGSDDKFYLKATLNAKTTRYRYGGGLLTNAVAVDRPYKFMVQALNSSGQVMAQGEDSTKALYPLGMPKLVSPANGAAGTTIQPQFQWTKVNNADGYFVEVFSGMYFVPTWRGYGAGAERIAMTYGDGGDFYPGTYPAVWTAVLTQGQRYTWTVTAIKTDTGNMATAKAIAESNAPSQIFVP
ncbi:MAG: hypothetical protein FJZ01_03635 [Candidatus Sericytochromatia bacterium]|nr:hypothetical protein [Candidatus Tanganyikabacteria bacterium]